MVAKHTLRSDGTVCVDTGHTDRIDEPGGAERIAKSLAAYWQSIYRRTHTPDNTDCSKIIADYPEHMCLTEPECEALGKDFAVDEVMFLHVFGVFAHGAQKS